LLALDRRRWRVRSPGARRNRLQPSPPSSVMGPQAGREGQRGQAPEAGAARQLRRVRLRREGWTGGVRARRHRWMNPAPSCSTTPAVVEPSSAATSDAPGRTKRRARTFVTIDGVPALLVGDIASKPRRHRIRSRLVLHQLGRESSEVEARRPRGGLRHGGRRPRRALRSGGGADPVAPGSRARRGRGRAPHQHVASYKGLLFASRRDRRHRQQTQLPWAKKVATGRCLGDAGM
jgi:hypothetical protein